MKLYTEKEQYKLYHGNMLDMLEVIEPNSIDSIVCDPPYELNFMGKGWDNSGIAFNKEAWLKCYEVLKPGGYLLAFGGARTYHRIACAIEDAGFEIRDCIMYLYGAGFPKSLNIGLAIDKKNGVESEVINTIKTHDFSRHKGSMMSFSNTEEQETSVNEVNIKKATNKWNGWGTALKPAYEPIIVARKPFKTSVAENVMQYGVGGINIDECRIATEELKTQKSGNTSLMGGLRNDDTNGGYECIPSELGRFPANVIHDGSEEAIKDMPNTNGGERHNEVIRLEDSTSFGGKSGYINTRNEFNDEGSASRYFYCAKASKKDRDEGLDMFENYYELKPNIPQEIINKIKTLLNY